MTAQEEIVRQPTADSSSADNRKALPYRWGYFQGVFLIPFSLLMLLSVWDDYVKPQHDPRYLAVIGYAMGIVGLPLGIALLRKKRFALKLVYVMFGLTLVLAAIKIPIAIRHFAAPGTRGSAFFEAELVLLWLLSLIYYRKRENQLT